MSNLLTVAIVLCGAASFGCWSSQPATNKRNTPEAKPRTTQTATPEPSKVVTNNPRDPRNRKIRPDTNPSATPEPSTPKPAAENSMASAMMNSDGSITEFRVFKGHPQIVKAEATWLDPTDKVVKVWLKSGKTLEARTDRIPYLHKVPSSLILEVVGVTPETTTTDRPRVIANK